MADPVAYCMEFVMEYTITAAPADTSVIDIDSFPNTRIKARVNAIKLAQTAGGFIYINQVKEVLCDLPPKIANRPTRLLKSDHINSYHRKPSTSMAHNVRPIHSKMAD